MSVIQESTIDSLKDAIRDIEIEGDEAMEEILCELIGDLELRLEAVRAGGF